MLISLFNWEACGSRETHRQQLQAVAAAIASDTGVVLGLCYNYFDPLSGHAMLACRLA